MTTVARTQTSESSHWYTRSGDPCYEVEKKKGGMRPATLADARKLDLLPSVTNILRCLNKPGLNTWLTEQAVLACMTAPRLADEPLDVFINRVLNVEKQQDEQAAKARQLGTDIHNCIEAAIKDMPYVFDFDPYVKPVMEWIHHNGKVVWSEKVLVGAGYAGRADALLENPLLNMLLLVDFKTCSKLPNSGSWLEHRLQTAAYAATLGNTNGRRIFTTNVYISTQEPGKIAVFTQDDWAQTYVKGFEPLIKVWQWLNDYAPGEAA